MDIFDNFRNGNNARDEESSAEHQCDRVSGIPFPAYRGKEPYMFISYAHDDSLTVYPVISEFNDMGYNVWYDEGIEPGIEWPEEIANALDRCSLFVVFITPAAADSPNVRNEINFALSKRLPFIAIYIKETALSPGLQLQMGTKQAILKYNMDEESFRRKYTYSFETALKPKSENPVPAVDPPALAQGGNAVLPDSPAKDMANEWEWIGSKLIRYSGSEREVTIPAKATAVYSNAFKDNTAIEKILIPITVSRIDFAAFYNCPNLRLVVIEGGSVAISEGDIPVASGCPELTFQCHQNSFTYNELEKAFSGPVSFFPGDSASTPYDRPEIAILDDFVIEHGLLRKYRGDAKEVRLPEEAQIIGGSAFNNCRNLESVILSDKCGAILDNAFLYCPRLKNITIGRAFSSLAGKAFVGCQNVRFSYYKDRVPDKFEQLFPDKSIVSAIDE